MRSHVLKRTCHSNKSMFLKSVFTQPFCFHCYDSKWNYRIISRRGCFLIWIRNFGWIVTFLDIFSDLNPFSSRRVLRLYTDETDANPEKLYTMDNLGNVLSDLIGCNLVAWVLIFFCLFKGVQSSVKVVYFTATFPYVVSIILVIFGATLDGASDGIEFYLEPESLWNIHKM